MSNLRSHLLGVFLCLVSTSLSAQYIEVGAVLGVATYQGDINPMRHRLSFEGAQAAKGISVGYFFNPTFGIKARFIDSFLKADDKGSFASDRVKRNLHFRTDIKELSISAEVELLNIIPWFSNRKLRPYVSAGVAKFWFNPQAKQNGIWYDLQPLGTEGQGLPGSDQELYSRSQVSLPIGGGVRYHINPNTVISFEVIPRVTFTDYIDDVSTIYPDLDLLRSHRGDLAADIAYKGDDIVNYVPTGADITGQARGNPLENDWYITSTITFSCRLDPAFTIGKKNKFAGYYHCPFF